MKRQIWWSGALAIVFGLATPAATFAQDEDTMITAAEASSFETDDDIAWKANAVFSGLLVTGNAENYSFGGNGLVAHKFFDNELTFTADGAYGRAQNGAGDLETNTKNWTTRLRYDRYLSNVFTLFASTFYNQNEPSGFENRYGAAGGYSHFLIKNDASTFKYELGYDYTFEDRVGGVEANIHSARAFLQATHKFNENVYVGQDVETLFNLTNGDDIRINTLTSLNVTMTQKMSLQLAYQVRFDNDPVSGFEKTDTQTQIGLNVTFL